MSGKKETAQTQREQKRLNKLKEEQERIERLRAYEEQYAPCGLICGIDEVGRGPFAGPVVAGAVILPPGCRILYINDSKKLSEKKREELYPVRLIFCRRRMKPCVWLSKI